MLDFVIALPLTIAAVTLATMLAVRGWFAWRHRSSDRLSALRMALDISYEALVACRGGRITHINDSARRLLGHIGVPMIGKNFADFIHPDYQLLCDHDFEALLLERVATPAKLLHGSGRVLDIQIVAWHSAEDPNDILVSLRDISDLMRANQNVAAQLKRLNSILDSAFDAIIVSDHHGHIEIFNNAAEVMFGFEAREILGKPLDSLFIEPISSHAASSADVTAKRKNGSVFPAELSLSPCQLEDRVLCTALVRDVTERKDFENHLAHAAMHDALTQLPNRNLLLDRLRMAITNAMRNGDIVAVWFFDLNGIKTVNDVMGHAAGDRLLISVGTRMAEIVGADGVVARFGGDEFAVVMRGFTHESEVAPAVEAFLQTLSRPFSLMGREVTVTANVGIALYPHHSRIASDLLLDASAAMMFSKIAGRNQFRFFDPIMHRQSEERLTLESELRRGIDRDELLLHYQPQVDVKTGKIIGLEALVRWQHPTRGLVPPGVFIPIAEQTGLILPLGEWVLRRACDDLGRLEERGIDHVRVAVNISPRQFANRDIVGLIHAVISETGVTPSLLDVEITESTLMSDPERVMVNLEELKALGVHISLDDFGTGFSSLNYLKRFPADTLKLDRSFITDLAVNPKDEAIATTIINLAHSLGMTVLAEGVEQIVQYEFLQHFQCDSVQGYLFSVPLSFDHVLDHLQDGTMLLPSTIDSGGPLRALHHL